MLHAHIQKANQEYETCVISKQMAPIIHMVDLKKLTICFRTTIVVCWSLHVAKMYIQ